jgi:hypothetical protein
VAVQKSTETKPPDDCVVVKSAHQKPHQERKNKKEDGQEK